MPWGIILFEGILMARVYLGSITLLLILAGCASCSGQLAGPRGTTRTASDNKQPLRQEERVQNPGRVVHVVVALCDNKYQGIVPVPERMGDGDDPANNLYWGAGFGVKSFFLKQRDWEFVSEDRNLNALVLERVVFKQKQKGVYLIADAYRGREIKVATSDFFQFASGRRIESIEVGKGPEKQKLSVGGGADLIAYVGHDGLMDFELTAYSQKADDRKREAIILACASKAYFDRALRQTGADPILWTTGLMAPEAYVLNAAVDGWILSEGGDKIRRSAAEAYNKYQHCGLKGAMNLFASGW
jgi:hypothetical protein